MTISSDVRTKVIDLARQGKGRNEIAYELSLANTKVSSGSVSNILKEWKNQSAAVADSIEIRNDQIENHLTSPLEETGTDIDQETPRTDRQKHPWR